MVRSSRWQTPLRLVLLSIILCVGSLQGVRAFVTPPTVEATAQTCAPPPLFARQPPVANAEECQVHAAEATTLPTDFSESLIFTGLDTPTSVRFAADGRVFIAEKSGLIKVFASLNATTPTIVVDLRDQVMDYYDRGLLSIALDPNFPATPDLYALYTYDAPPGSTAPFWHDACTDPFAATTEGCVVTGHLSRFHINFDGSAGPEELLIDSWCQQFPSHSVGDMEFGSDGALYVSVGEGANYMGVDAGQYGVPTPNPCGDPQDTHGGGALRAQDVRPGGNPLGYSGTVLRVNTAAPSDRRVVAYGLRNPFRMTTRPNTQELWVGNVGWDTWETIDRIPDITSSPATNFGWPCYEGAFRQVAYEAAELPICNALYANTGAVTPPHFAYQHYQPFPIGDGCITTDSSITGLAFYNGGNYPAEYDGALFFGDYTRSCIWVMPRGTNGTPDPSKVTLFAGGASGPVDIVTGPNGDLFYLDIYQGTLRRIRYLAPTADIRADKTAGAVPLTVHFDGSNSSTPRGGSLTYSWDLNGDGIYGDATTPTAEHTYAAGSYTVGLRVTNDQGGIDTKTIAIMAGLPPTVAITAPTADATWQVGTVFNFSGTASSLIDGPLPASAYTWTLILYHCPSGYACHTHILQRFNGVTSGTFSAPDHEYPSSLELRFTVRDAVGLTTMQSVRIYPQTTNINITTEPAGQAVTVNSGGQTAPFTLTVIRGSANVLSPPTESADSPLIFTGWVVDGQAIGWVNPLVLTAQNDRFVKAVFAPRPRYNDVGAKNPAATAIMQLGARGIIHGYGDGNFGPGDTILRAQMAGLIARAMDWGDQHWANPFPDQGKVDGELWQAVGTLNHFDVARGYPGGTFNPTDPVVRAQAISFIARAMVARGYWQPQQDNSALYPEVPASSGHRGDIATYVYYAGALPDFPRDQPFAGWDGAGNRAWFTQALWQALDSYFR